MIPELYAADRLAPVPDKRNHFIERRNHLALAEFTPKSHRLPDGQMECFFASLVEMGTVLNLLEEVPEPVSLFFFTRICSAAAVFAMIVP